MFLVDFFMLILFLSRNCLRFVTLLDIEVESATNVSAMTSKVYSVETPASSCCYSKRDTKIYSQTKWMTAHENNFVSMCCAASLCKFKVTVQLELECNEENHCRVTPSELNKDIL